MVWRTVWNCTPTSGVAAETEDLRQRLTVTSNVGGERLRVRLSSASAAGGAREAGDGTSVLDQLHVSVNEAAPEPVLLLGSARFALRPGDVALSDPVAVQVRPGDRVEVASQSRGRQPAAALSVILAGGQAQLSSEGQVRAVGPGAEMLRQMLAMPGFGAVSGIVAVEVETVEPVTSIALFGDSITQMGFWPAALERQLREEFPGRSTVRNLGIAGNRMLHDAPPSAPSFGPAGVRRFETDVFDPEPVSVAVVLMGVNDLVHPVAIPAAAGQVVGSGELLAAFESLAALAHEHGARAIACTIPPYAGNGGWTPEGEAVRQDVNKQLRAATWFDAVVDLETALASASAPPRLRDEFHLGDYLHPNPAGGQAIAAAVITELRQFLPPR